MKTEGSMYLLNELSQLTWFLYIKKKKKTASVGFLHFNSQILSCGLVDSKVSIVCILKNLAGSRMSSKYFLPTLLSTVDSDILFLSHSLLSFVYYTV